MKKLGYRMVALAVCSAVVVACGEDDSVAPSLPVPTPTVSLAAICPDPVVIQTDWNPEAEHGALYQMVGANPQVDTAAKRVTGRLMDGAVDTGVRLEVRIGGPAIDFRPVTAEMYRDPSILLGYVNTDEAIRYSATQPTLAVVTPLEVSPQMIMWDPATYPDFRSIADIGQTDTLVYYSAGHVYMEYLLGAGILKRSQVDGSYDGTPQRFLAAGGRAAQQGFASSEPYFYEHELPAWGKPVAFQLIHATGYEIYAQALALRAGDLAAQRACLTRLVPIIQRAQVAFVTDPARANALIIELVRQYATGWTYTPGIAAFSVAEQRQLGLVGNGPDGVLGNFDRARVQRVIDTLLPIFSNDGVATKPGLSPDDLVTNEFIDPNVTLQ